MRAITSLAAGLALASTASAHGGVLFYIIAGTYYQGFVPYNTPTGQNTIQREWDSYNPILDPTQDTLRCNANGAVANEVATVAAGSVVQAFWNNPWPHDIGPMVVWMANCGGDCANFDGSGNVWFKINQVGLVSGTQSSGVWGSGQMINDNSSWTTTIPASLAPGNYLIRHETIALHTANQPQWYPECGTLTITGSGTGVPSGQYLTSIPGVYSMSDPNINIDVYSSDNTDATTWAMPGPPVWPSGATGNTDSNGNAVSGETTGEGSGGSSATTTTSRASTTLSTTIKPTTTTGTTVRPTTTTTTTTSSGSSSGGGAAEYAQCGGSGWTGTTTCQSPYTCQVINPYYSQCLS